MTPQGKKTLEILTALEQDAHHIRPNGVTAQDITDNFSGLENRNKPVMTVSSYLTHLKRLGYVKRFVSSDKTVAWWRSTREGRKALADVTEKSQAARNSN